MGYHIFTQISRKLRSIIENRISKNQKYNTICLTFKITNSHQHDKKYKIKQEDTIESIYGEDSVKIKKKLENKLI